jgi:hypothetical protein
MNDLVYAHELKIWPMYYREVVDGQKRFEIRRADRTFLAGQMVRLREYIPETAESGGGYTGGQATILITYVVTKFAGIADGYCVFGFVLLRDE